jgi:hypothetical protein
VEGVTNQTYREIQRLPIGVALISGAALQKPIMAEIRTRETSHGGRSVTISKGGKISNYPSPKIQTSNPQPEIKTEISDSKPTKNKATEKAINVTRVAKRLGWISIDDPDEAINILTNEAEKMNENVYKYLESLANLGRKFCYENEPGCINCPMKDGCKYRASHGTDKKKGFFRKR